MSSLRQPVIHLKDVQFGWKPGTVVLDIPELLVNQGEKVFIRGPSGSGKTTLLGLLGGVLTPVAGDVSVLGSDIGRFSSARRIISGQIISVLSFRCLT